jgi:hypothetical protein
MLDEQSVIKTKNSQQNTVKRTYSRTIPSKNEGEENGLCCLRTKPGYQTLVKVHARNNVCRAV